MMKKVLLGVFSILLIGFLFFQCTKLQKEPFRCSLIEEYVDYPLNIEPIKQSGENCVYLHDHFNRKKILRFSADGIQVKIKEKNNHLEKKDKIKGIEKQVTYHQKPISIRYRSHKGKRSLDIDAMFTFQQGNYQIEGRIKGIYTRKKKENINLIPDSVMEQTEERIMKFIDTYIKEDL